MIKCNNNVTAFLTLNTDGFVYSHLKMKTQVLIVDLRLLLRFLSKIEI